MRVFMVARPRDFVISTRDPSSFVNRLVNTVFTIHISTHSKLPYITKFALCQSIDLQHLSEVKQWSVIYNLCFDYSHSLSFFLSSYRNFQQCISVCMCEFICLCLLGARATRYPFFLFAIINFFSHSRIHRLSFRPSLNGSATIKRLFLTLIYSSFAGSAFLPRGIAAFTLAVISLILAWTRARFWSICVLFVSYTLGNEKRATTPMMMSVMPLNHAPRYVRDQRTIPNLSESTMSSTKKSLRSSLTAALALATAMSATSCTFSEGNVRSISRMSLNGCPCVSLFVCAFSAHALPDILFFYLPSSTFSLILEYIVSHFVLP